MCGIWDANDTGCGTAYRRFVGPYALFVAHPARFNSSYTVLSSATDMQQTTYVTVDVTPGLRFPRVAPFSYPPGRVPRIALRLSHRPNRKAERETALCFSLQDSASFDDF